MWILQIWMTIERIKPRLHCSLALLKLPFILHLTTHGYSEFLIILLREFLQTFLSNVQKCEDSPLHLKEKQKLIHQSSRAFANLRSSRKGNLILSVISKWLTSWHPLTTFTFSFEALGDEFPLFSSSYIMKFSAYPISQATQQGAQMESSLAHFRLLPMLCMFVNIYKSFLTARVLASGHRIPG